MFENLCSASPRGGKLITAVSVHLINFAKIVYHQSNALYLVIVKAIQPAVDDIRFQR